MHLSKATFKPKAPASFYMSRTNWSISSFCFVPIASAHEHICLRVMGKCSNSRRIANVYGHVYFLGETALSRSWPIFGPATMGKGGRTNNGMSLPSTNHTHPSLRTRGQKSQLMLPTVFTILNLANVFVDAPVVFYCLYVCV